MGKWLQVRPAIALLASALPAVGLAVVLSSMPVAHAATGSGSEGTRVTAFSVTWSPSTAPRTLTSPSAQANSRGDGVPLGCPAPQEMLVAEKAALARLLRSCAHAPYVAHVVETPVPSAMAIHPSPGGGAGSSLSTPVTYYGPGNTYSDWYFPDQSGYDSLQWTFQPVRDPPLSLAKQGLLHYYAYNFALVNESPDIGGGYAGMQSNGVFNGHSEGKAINFSIWGSNGAKSASRLVTLNTECRCFQIMYKYPWVAGHQFAFQLKHGPHGTDSLGTWWGLWVTDKTTKVTKLIGEQRVPNVIDGQPATKWSNHTSVFGEDTHWWNTLEGNKQYTNCTAFQSSSLSTLNVRAQVATKPSAMNYVANGGEINTGTDGFQTTNCPVGITVNSHHDVQHFLGYWRNSYPSKLPSYSSLGDVTPPTPPGPLQSFATTATTISLQWYPSTDDAAVAGYDVYRDGSKIVSVPGYSATYVDTGVQAGATHTYSLVARDLAGNSSEPSNSVQVTAGTSG